MIHGTAIRAYVEMSTVGKDTVEHIARGLIARGIDVVDAPVTGGPAAARAGHLSIMLSGSETALAMVQPMLKVMSSTQLVLGERPGLAQTMKVISNLIMATHAVATCEGLSMGAKAGLDPRTMLKVIESGTAGSFAASKMVRRAVEGTFDFGAALSIVAKDTSIGLRELVGMKLEMPVIKEACDTWQAAMTAGMGGEDFTSILKLIERKNDVVVRASHV